MDEGPGALEILIPAGIGLGISAAVSAALIFIVGAAIYATADPNKLVTAASLAIAAVASFTAGFAGSKRGGSFLCGVISGRAHSRSLCSARFSRRGRAAGACMAPHGGLR